MSQGIKVEHLVTVMKKLREETEGPTVCFCYSDAHNGYDAPLGLLYQIGGRH
jgi:hypothetical protein